MPRLFLLSVMTAIVAGAALLGACFDKPEPACAFWCGIQSACPDGYRCATDEWCKRDDVPDDHACGPGPQDAAPAPPDAAPDAALDAAPDASLIDATPSDAVPAPAIDAALPDANGAGLR